MRPISRDTIVPAKDFDTHNEVGQCQVCSVEAHPPIKIFSGPVAVHAELPIGALPVDVVRSLGIGEDDNPSVEVRILEVLMVTFQQSEILALVRRSHTHTACACRFSDVAQTRFPRASHVGGGQDHIRSGRDLPGDETAVCGLLDCQFRPSRLDGKS